MTLFLLFLLLSAVRDAGYDISLQQQQRISSSAYYGHYINNVGSCGV
jgi:hypothetical protein